ncbi:MAG: TonB-dependent receptor [Fulvivirga sp.]
MRIISHLILYLFVILVSQQGISQVVRGKVVDSKTGAPLVGATVQSTDGINGTTTDIKGQFEVASTSTVQVSHVGYESQKVKLTSEFVRIQLVQSTTQLGEVVVNAYKAERNLLTVPAPVAVIGSSDLNRADNNSIIPILNAVPGVKIDYYTIGDYRLNIRGGALAQPSVHSSGYRMYWNGIPISTASGGNPLGGLDINFIDNLEIIKGPGSSLYGAGFGGTVLVNTERAKKQGTFVSTDFMLGGYGTLRSTSGINHNGSKGNIAMRYTRSLTDGYRNMTDSEGDVLNLYGQLYTSPNGEINFLYNYENRNVEIAGDLDEDAFYNAAQTANTIDPTGFGPNKHTIGLGYNHVLNERWSGTMGAYYFDNKGEFVLSFPFFAIFDKEPSSGFNTRTTVQYKNQIGNVGIKIDGGLEYGYAKNEGISYDGNFETDTASVITSNLAKTNQLLAFGQAELVFSEDVFVTVGLSFNQYQYDIENGTNEPNPILFDEVVSQVAPRISLLKKLGTYSIYTSAGQGFNPPAAGIFNDFLNPDGSVNNLKPSTGWNWEIGSRGNPMNGLFFYDIAFYNLEIKDAIISRLFEISPGVNAERKTNAGEVRQTGIEATVGMNVSNDPEHFWYGSQFRLGYTFNDFEYKIYQTFSTEFDEDFNSVFVPVDYSGQDVPGTIPHSWVIMADIKTEIGVYLNFTFNQYDKTFLTDENIQTHPSYSVVNLKTGWKHGFSDDRFEVHPYVGVNNLGNTLYSGLTAYNSTFGGFFNPAFRRQWFGGISLNIKL